MVAGTKTLDVFVNVNFLLLWTPCSFSNISFFFKKKEKIKLSPFCLPNLICTFSSFCYVSRGSINVCEQLDSMSSKLFLLMSEISVR